MPECFTYAELQALPDMSGKSNEAIDAAEAYFVGIVEREIKAALVPRSHTVTLSGDGSKALVLPHQDVQSLTTVTVDGVSVTVGDLTFQYGILRYADESTWATGVDNVAVTYTAGFAECPAAVKDPLMWAVRDRLLSQGNSSAIDVRKTSVTNEFGGTTNYVLAGEKRPTGYPDLDAAIATFQRSTAGGFA